MIENNEFALEAVRAKLKALLAEVEAALGINGSAHTQDSGDNSPPPVKPPVNQP